MESFGARKASIAFPMGDFFVRRQDHQCFQNIWIERVQKGKLVTVAEVSREQTQFSPKVDLTKESL